MGGSPLAVRSDLTCGAGGEPTWRQPCRWRETGKLTPGGGLGLEQENASGITSVLGATLLEVLLWTVETIEN